jgi:hypothetical protein
MRNGPTTVLLYARGWVDVLLTGWRAFVQSSAAVTTKFCSAMAGPREILMPFPDVDAKRTLLVCRKCRG